MVGIRTVFCLWNLGYSPASAGTDMPGASAGSIGIPPTLEVSRVILLITAALGGGATSRNVG